MMGHQELDGGQGLLPPPTKAHAASEAYVIDPAYSSTETIPTRQNSGNVLRRPELADDDQDGIQGWWVYGDGELELYRLSVSRRRAKNAKLNVWYPGKFNVPSRQAFFKISASDLDEYFRFSTNGKVKVFLIDSNGEAERLVYQAETAHDVHSVTVENTAVVKVELEAVSSGGKDDEDEPPCLWMDKEEYASSLDVELADNMPETCGWEWSSDGRIWSQCQYFASVPGASYPHRAEVPVISLAPKGEIPAEIDGRMIKLFDFGLELLGRIVVKCHVAEDYEIGGQDAVFPQLFVGESIAEATDDNLSNQEQSTELVQQRVKSGQQSPPAADDTKGVMQTWTSANLVAFRFARVVVPDGISLISISCQATFHPVQYKGAFACSDEKLNRIWLGAAYTLRLCMHDFFLDGIKRDRLPWSGDLAVSLLSNAFSFADADIVARSLTVLGRSGITENDINGYVDYSLWWIICNDLYQRYFGDMAFLHREWPRIRQAIDCLVSRCDEYGLIIVEKGKEMVFVDWVNAEKTTALQILWWWALKSGASIAKRIGSCEFVADWNLCQAEVKDRLMLSCWDDTAGLWTAAPVYQGNYSQGDYSRHANILAVVSGLCVNPNDLDRIARGLIETEMAAVGTPYMKIFECLALARLGQANNGLRIMRQYWGRMLDQGSSTFWEAYNPTETNEIQTAFYERPFGRSLCHAWSAGPCHYIPDAIFGIRPLSDGWETWTCSPNLPSDLDWACATIPTPVGSIEIELSAEMLTISIPGKTTMELNGASHQGPHKISICPRDPAIIGDCTVKEWSRPYRGWHYFPHHVIPARPNIAGCEGVHMTDVPTVYQLPGKNNSNKWFMSFIGFDGNGYQSFVAESIDLIKWTDLRLAFGFGKEGEFDYGGRVIGAFLYEDYDIKAPRVLKRKDGKFWGLYGAYSKQGKYEIDPGYEGVACSDDGIEWQRASDRYILSVHDDDAKEWEKDSIYQPFLLQVGDVYYNFYNAKRLPEWIEQVGMATSTDLMNWTRHPDNPVLRVRPGGFDSNFVADAKVYRDGDHWTMFYFGVGHGKAHIMTAFSEDLVRWSADPDPLYQAGQHPYDLDTEHAHKTSLVYNPANETFYMYYCAVGRKGRGIGLITSKKWLIPGMK